MSEAAVPVLVLDTATPAVTAAVVAVGAAGAAGAAGAVGAVGAVGAGVTPVAVRVAADARRHGELLAPAIAAVLAEAGLTPADLAAVVAGTGPGPFTGLRVGLVTAAALADALSIPAYGVCSLDGLMVPGDVLAVTDARRKEVYWAAYADGARTAGPGVDRPADLAARLRELGVTAMTGARAYSEVLGLPAVGPESPDPVALARVAADRVRSGAPADRLTPLYLRNPDAVEPGRPKAVTPA